MRELHQQENYANTGTVYESNIVSGLQTTFKTSTLCIKKQQVS